MSAIIRDERIGNQRLILGDCIAVMPELGRFDAVVTDPPYGIKRDKGFGSGGSSGWGGFYARREGVKRYRGDWDRDRPSEEFFRVALDVAPDAIIWGGQFFADVLPPQGKWLWWDKCQTMPSFGDGELAWTTLRGDAPKKFVYSNNGLMAREKDRVHPTQKPVALMEWCLGFLPAAKTILDPFMGSGTTLVACQRMGRHGTGIEIDPEYFGIACRRVDEAARQPDLLIPETRPAPVQFALQMDGNADSAGGGWGMIRLGLVLWLIGVPVLAQDAVSLAGTVIRLQATTQPGAEAEVTFDNRNVNGPEHDGPFSLIWGGIRLTGQFTWDAAGTADSITVTPPPGYVCRPAACALEVEEDQTGTLWLFSIEGVGM